MRFRIFTIVSILIIGKGIAQVPELVNPNSLSPITQLLLLEPENSSLFPLKIGSSYPCLFSHVNEEEVPDGIEYSKTGNIFSAWLTKGQIGQLSKSVGIGYIEASGRLNSPKPLTDTTKILTKTIDVHSGAGVSPFLGTNAIVGIVDIGFEGSHPNFMDANGTKLRVKNWWHQNTTFGSPPAGFTYGAQFTKEQDIKIIGDPDGSHGTHVAGIAAGSGFTTPNRKYSGMAPAAEMVWVSIRHTNDSLNGSAYGDYVVANPTIIDGYKHIFDYATSVNKPASINLSWGMNTGPHDGSSLFDLAVESLVGNGKIVVGSSGNSANNNMHVQLDLNSDTLYTWAYDRNRNRHSEEEIYCDFWGSPNKNFGINVSLYDTLGNKLLVSPFFMSNGKVAYKQTFINGSDTLTVTALPNKKYAANEKGEVLLIVKSNNPDKSRIRLGFRGEGTIHGWNSGQPYRWTSGSFTNSVKGNDYKNDNSYKNGTRSYSNGENGGTGNSVISVGSYIPRNSWTSVDTVFRTENLTIGEISSFSSIGPNVGGRTKPDISAPGSLVISSYKTENIAPWQTRSVLFKSTWNNEEHAWILASGTSMASPHVCGIIALMLDANPRLNPGQIREILRKTALKDSYTGSEDSNNTYGFGKINALEAVKEVVRINSTVAFHPSDIIVFPIPTNGELIISGMPNAQVSFYEISGKLVKVGQLNNYNTIQVDDLAPGVYVLKATAELRSIQTKIIIER